MMRCAVIAAFEKIGEPMTFDDSFQQSVVENLYDGLYCVDRNRTITYWNQAAERISGYAACEVQGKSCSDNLLGHVSDTGVSLCKGLCPLAKSMVDGKTREAMLYLHHKDGHRVPIRVRVAPMRDTSGAIVGGVEIFNETPDSAAVKQKCSELQHRALCDLLTGTANRRWLEMSLRSKLKEMKSYGWPVGLLSVQIDEFPRFVDTYGSDRGDDVLRMVARTLSLGARSTDVVGRWGKEHFAVIVPHADAALLATLSERACALVAASSLPRDRGNLKVTVSVGSTLAQPYDTEESLLQRCEKHQQASREAGGNQATGDLVQ
ncbi:MAG: diguanylate cyclase [Myxococcales bacterium]